MCLILASLSHSHKLARSTGMDGWRDPRLQKEPWTCLQGGTGGFLNSMKCFSLEIKMKKEMGTPGGGKGCRREEIRKEIMYFQENAVGVCLLSASPVLS